MSSASVTLKTGEILLAIYTGNYATFGLKTDGTVVAAGQNKYGELDLDSWEDISGFFHIRQYSSWAKN